MDFWENAPKKSSFLGGSRKKIPFLGGGSPCLKIFGAPLPRSIRKTCHFKLFFHEKWPVLISFLEKYVNLDLDFHL